MEGSSVEIEFLINSDDVLEEFRRVISGSKNADEAIDRLRKRYSEMNIAQVAGIKGANDLNSAINEIGNGKIDFFGVTKENIALQKQAIKELETELKELNKRVENMAPGKARGEVISEVKALERELLAEKKTLSEIESA